jgi:hypothetical protein
MTAAPPLKTSRAFLIARDGWLKTVASYPNLSGADVAAAVALAMYFNRKTGTAWPSMETSSTHAVAINLIGTVQGSDTPKIPHFYVVARLEKCCELAT